ncbi:MAG: agmatinase [Eubacterium sp.]|nr:agmatinase [Eubacterium sp.]
MSELKDKQMTGNGPAGLSTFFHLPYSKDFEGKDYVVFGTPFDTLTTARGGTRLGPSCMREAYGNSRYNTDLKVDIYRYLDGVDYGDIPVYNGETMKTFKSITDNIEMFAKAGVIPVNLGGDHSIAFPELMGYKKVYGKVAIVHFDSHSDTGYHEMSEEAPYDHGTPFKDAIENDCVDTEHSIQVGMRGANQRDTHDFAHKSGMDMITAYKLHEIGIDEAAKWIRKKVGDAPVFVTFDIDFLDPAYAPGTGTPVQGGFSTWEALELIRKGLLGLNFVGFNIVCVDPLYDIGDITAMAGSRIAYEFISMLACKEAGITTYKGFGK